MHGIGVKAGSPKTAVIKVKDGKKEIGLRDVLLYLVIMADEICHEPTNNLLTRV